MHYIKTLNDQTKTRTISLTKIKPKKALQLVIFVAILIVFGSNIRNYDLL